MTIKAISETRFGGYGVLFGSPAQKDLQGEYFTAATDYALGWTNQRPALYHHGQDAAIGAEPIGTIDTVKADAIGLWLEGQWNSANRYADAVKQLAKEGKLGWSSGTLSYLKRVDPDGKITRWPLVEASMTPTPAEPRATGVSAKHYAEQVELLSAFKSIGMEPNLSLLQEPATPSAKNSASEANEAAPEAVQANKESQIMGITQDALNALITQAAEAGAQKALAAQPAPVAPPTKTLENVPDPLKDAKAIVPQPGEARITVTRATKYSDLSAEQMEIVLAFKANKRQSVTEDFFREYQDKVAKAVSKGELPASAAFKSNELNYSTYTSYGDEYVPTATSSNLWEKVRQANLIFNLFEKINMPSNPYDLPIESGDPTVSKVAETADLNKTAISSTNFTPSKVGTNKITLTAVKLGIQVLWSRELSEDALLPILALIQRKSERAMMNAFDNVLINGDTDTSATTNVNAIDTTPGGTEKYLVVNGLRKYGLVTNTTQKLSAAGAAPSADLFRQLRGKLGAQYMHDLANVFYIVDDYTFLKMINMPEYSTVDKFGDMAVNKTGKISLFDGIPVYPSYELGLTRTDGKTHSAGTGNSYGSAVLVHRDAFKVGIRRDVNMYVDTLPYADANALTMTARIAFSTTFDTTAAAVLYYLGV